MTDKKKPLILVVSVVIINKNKQILMQERPKNKNFGGYWELPGGKIELYETPEIALLREIFIFMSNKRKVSQTIFI